MHAVLVDRVWQLAIVERQAGYTAMAAGVAGVEPLDPQHALEVFDASLGEAPEVVVIDSERDELLLALGLRADPRTR